MVLDNNNLKEMTPLGIALLIGHYLLPNELVHQVGQVSQHKGKDYSHGEVGSFYPCPGE